MTNPLYASERDGHPERRCYCPCHDIADESPELLTWAELEVLWGRIGVPAPMTHAEMIEETLSRR